MLRLCVRLILGLAYFCHDEELLVTHKLLMLTVCPRDAAQNVEYGDTPRETLIETNREPRYAVLERSTRSPTRPIRTI